MKYIALAILTSLALVGCGEPNTTTPPQEDPSSAAIRKTPGLEDCTLYRHTPYGGSSSMYITRCGGVVSTTYPQGKGHETSITIDGVEYVKK